MLSVEALDKMHACIDLLCEQGYMDQQSSLRETYEQYLNIYKIERDAPKMWEMVWNHEIQALFQMEQQSGIQGIALTKPSSVDDLAVLNSVIRLMAQEKDAEQPLEKYARFKNDIKHWYREMDRYGLTKEEQDLLEPIVGGAYGICESQEKFMSLVQMPECGGHDLTWADKLRKAIAKKNPEGFVALEKDFFKTVEEKGLSQRFCNYVWNVLVSTSKGYGFNASHTLAYSLVALQEMNLAYNFPIIFWNCACLITDSGGAQEIDEDGGIYFDEVETEEIVGIYEEENFEEYEYEDAPDRKSKKKKARSTNYDKIAIALGKMRQEGVVVEPPNINQSAYTFKPDVDNNTIIYGLSGLLGVGEDVIKDTIKNRPYASPKDYYQKVKPKKGAMISLIKAGAFDKMMDRKLCMGWFLYEVCDKKKRLTLQNLPGLIKYDKLPKEEEFITARRVYEFNRYLKAMCKFDSDYYKLDERALNFLIELGYEEMIVDGLINIKLWTKKYEMWMDLFRDWIKNNKEEILQDLNSTIFLEEWNKYAKGSIASWEMNAMCYYYHDHELKHVNKEKYGISNYFELSETPEIERSFLKNGRMINMFKLTKIVGTCIAKNKAKGLVTLLTPDGVVTVKFRKEYFAIFDKQLSVKLPGADKKTVIEKSWFNRGNMIIVQGVRQGDNFVAKKYASSAMQHQLYKIVSIDDKGNVQLQDERKSVE